MEFYSKTTSAIHQDYMFDLNLVEEKAGEKGWSRMSWKNYTARQQPDWPDPLKVEKAQKQLTLMPPLVSIRDIKTLKQELASAVEGKAFILQGGDCSENFRENNTGKINRTCKTLARMAAIIRFSAGKPLIKIGRMAGQYAKPRSSGTETANGMVYSSYRGDLVNDIALNIKARKPDPERILKGYSMAQITLAYLEFMEASGGLSAWNLAKWNDELRDFAPLYDKYRVTIDNLGTTLDAIQYMDNKTHSHGHKLSKIYTCHEALLLPYEAGLIRRDTSDGRWYNSSGHMLWIGDRTRQTDSAHIELLRGVSNPIGVKVGPDHSTKEISELCRILNPDNKAGRLSLITRLGRDKTDELLPPLIREIKASGHKILWITDPMHGNTFTSESGYKTRRYEDIISEIQSCFRIHAQEKTVLGGIHLEMTGDNVTECLGGSYNICDKNLKEKYLTSCDPRLNEKQSLEIALDVARMIEAGN